MDRDNRHWQGVPQLQFPRPLGIHSGLRLARNQTLSMLSGKRGELLKKEVLQENHEGGAVQYLCTWIYVNIHI